jgi:hypothetical protein
VLSVAGKYILFYSSLPQIPQRLFDDSPAHLYEGDREQWQTPGIFSQRVFGTFCKYQVEQILCQKGAKTSRYKYPLRPLPEDIGEPIDTSLRRLSDDMVRVSLAEIPLTSIRF